MLVLEFTESPLPDDLVRHTVVESPSPRARVGMVHPPPLKQDFGDYDGLCAETIIEHGSLNDHGSYTDI